MIRTKIKVRPWHSLSSSSSSHTALLPIGTTSCPSLPLAKPQPDHVIGRGTQLDHGIDAGARPKYITVNNFLCTAKFPSPFSSFESSPISTTTLIARHVECLNLLCHPSLFLPLSPYQSTVHAFISPDTAPPALSIWGTTVVMVFVKTMSLPSLSPLTPSLVLIGS